MYRLLKWVHFLFASTIIVTLLVTPSYASSSSSPPIPILTPSSVYSPVSIPQLPQENPKIMYLLEDSLLYTTYSNHTISIYRYFFKDNQIVKIGSLSNVATGVSSFVPPSNHLYFYVGHSPEEPPINTLYSIDLQLNTVSPVYNSPRDDSLPGIKAYSFSGKIFSLRKVRNSADAYSTYLSFYDIEKNKWASFNEKAKSSSGGVDIVAIYSDKEFLYSLERHFSLSGRLVKCELVQFDENLNVIEKFQLVEDMLSQSTHSIREMVVENEHLYLQTTSGIGILGEIQNKSITPVTSPQKGLRCAINCAPLGKSTHSIYYFSKGDSLFILDNKKATLTELPANLNQGLPIRKIFVNGQSLLIDCYTPLTPIPPLNKAFLYTVDGGEVHG